MSKASAKVRRLWGRSLQEYMQKKRHEEKDRRHMLRSARNAMSVYRQYKPLDTCPLSEILFYSRVKGIRPEFANIIRAIAKYCDLYV